jgi:trimeric autotransporter adhesin
MRCRLVWPLLAAAISSGQTITDFAGNGTPGYAGDNGPAAQAEVNRVVGLATDASGNIYLADQNNNVVRKVSTSGIITTFAGTGGAGYTGDGGPATQAQLSGPLGVCVAPSGVIYVNDYGNRRVRAISTGGTISTVAGNGSSVSSGDGGPATSAGFVIPIRCAVDQSGNLYIVDQGAYVIRKVNTSGTISTFAGVANVPGFTGDGGPATQAEMNNPTAVSFDSAGNLYVSDQFNQRVREINPSGIIQTVAGNGVAAFAGDGGPATAASLNYPGETVIDSAGNLFIVDPDNQVVRKVTGGIISTIAGTPGVTGNSGDGGPPLQATFNGPFALTSDNGGNLYVGDINNNRVRKISSETASGPSVCSGCVLNAASFAKAANGNGTAVAPGSLVAIFTSPLATSPAEFSTATLPPSLSDVSVAFNGIAAPMVQVVPTGAYPFVSAQVPFEVLSSGQTSASASLVVMVNGVSSTPVQTPIVASAPGIFTIPATGLGNGILVYLNPATNAAAIAAPANSGLGLPSAPIPRGTNGFFYVNGLGAMTPSVPDGSGTCPAPTGCNANATPQVLIGGISAPVAFAGQAPGYPGVFQVNITVPANAPTGSSVSLVVKSADGTVTSNTATIAVQ